MAEKDITEKLLEDYHDVFADIINVIIFGGKQRVKPNDLEDTQTHSQYKADDNKIHEQERDVVKYWKQCNVEFAICGLENQTKVEKFMPFRVMSYDGASYRKQLLEEKKQIVPVITIVLYFGTDHHWNKAKNIKSLMTIPDGLENFVNDYKIHVSEIAWLTDEQISMFQSDFKIVANFFVQKRKNKDYVPQDSTEIKHVDEVLKLLSVMTGDHRYEDILSELTGKEGVKNMCDVAERIENKGRSQERRDIIANMLSSGKTAEEISSFVGIPLEEVKEVEASRCAKA